MKKVENKICLGIYITQNSATVVAVSLYGNSSKIHESFVINIDEDQPDDPSQLADIIKQSCSEKNIKFEQAFVALDSTLYNQHQIHSDFHDRKQIASTVRFDTEETIASDISDITLTFEIDRDDPETGTYLNVYTAKTKTLNDILNALKKNGIDPVIIEPDICSLARFIRSSAAHDHDQADQNNLYAVLSQKNAYLLVPRIDFDKKHTHSQSLLNRSFLIGSHQQRNLLLKTQIPVTTSLAKHDLNIDKIKFFDSTNSLDQSTLTDTLSVKTEKFPLNEYLAENKLPDDISYDCTDIAIAIGAALAANQKHLFVNFRDDFAPYMGRKIKIQNALKTLSVLVSIILFAMGLYLQMRLVKLNNYNNSLDQNVKKQFAMVMSGRKPSKRISPLSQLKSELKRVKDVKSGQLSLTGAQSIPAKLTFILEALNAIAAKTSLNIDTINVTTKTMTVVGDTSSTSNTLKLFDSIRQKQLDISRERLETKGSRNNFNIDLKIIKAVE